MHKIGFARGFQQEQEQEKDRELTFAKVISDGAIGVAAGKEHSIVLKQDGSVWTTGRNDHGQLGDWTNNTNKNSFAMVVSSGQ